METITIIFFITAHCLPKKTIDFILFRRFLVARFTSTTTTLSAIPNRSLLLRKCHQMSKRPSNMLSGADGDDYCFLILADCFYLWYGFIFSQKIFFSHLLSTSVCFSLYNSIISFSLIFTNSLHSRQNRKRHHLCCRRR